MWIKMNEMSKIDEGREWWRGQIDNREMEQAKKDDI